MTKDEMKDKISMALKDPILQQGFEVICKENAELKEQIEQMKCCENCRYYSRKDQARGKPGHNSPKIFGYKSELVRV